MCSFVNKYDLFVIAMEHSDRGNLTGLWIASQARNDKEKTQKNQKQKSANCAVNTMCCVKQKQPNLNGG